MIKRRTLVLTGGVLIALFAAACVATDGQSDPVGLTLPGPEKPTTLIGGDLQAPAMNLDAARESQRRSSDEAYSAAGKAPAAPGEQAQADRMIVYNASVSLEVDAVGDAVSAVRTLTEASGGIVAGASTRFQGEAEYATLTLRVPSGEYNRVMTRLRDLSVRVVTENGSAKDVTEEFSDLGAQLRNHEATEAQYLELLGRANTIDEVLKVQVRLSEVRGQIERTKGRINLLQKTSDMATIVVNLAPAGAGSSPKKPQPAWDPARSVQEAWEGSLRLVQAFADVTLRVLVFSWWLVPLVFLAWALWSSRRRPAPAAS